MGTSDSAVYDGETISCPVNGSCPAAAFNINSDYLKGEAMQVIGYAPDQECDDNNKVYKI